MSLFTRFATAQKKAIDDTLSDSQNDAKDWAAIGIEVFKVVFLAGTTVYLMYKTQQMMATLTDSLQDRSQESAQVTRKALAKRLKRRDVIDMTFDSYELRLLADVMGSDEIDVSFSDIGGMEEQLEEVNDNVVLPMQLWAKYRAIGADAADVDQDLSACPTGVLLYGQPGTGKSLTAKAIAKESGATFLNIKASSIMDKYLGESDKMVSAIFRVARKLAPTVVFIDEIDTVLRKRGGDMNNSHVQSMQGVFLAEWDGLSQDNRVEEEPLPSADKMGKFENNSALEEKRKQDRFLARAPVVVLGATNRPTDLDKAFLRRMPVQIQTFMPDLTARVAIFRAQLQKDTLAEDVNLSELAAATENFSGSDIREVIRVAKQQRSKALIRDARESLNKNSESEKNNAGAGRALTQAHFQFALDKSVAAASRTHNFGKKQSTQEVLDRFAGLLNVGGNVTVQP